MIFRSNFPIFSEHSKTLNNLDFLSASVSGTSVKHIDKISDIKI